MEDKESHTIDSMEDKKSHTIDSMEDREVRKEEALDDLPWQDEKGPPDEYCKCFKGNVEEWFWDTVWRTWFCVFCCCFLLSVLSAAILLPSWTEARIINTKMYLQSLTEGNGTVLNNTCNTRQLGRSQSAGAVWKSRWPSWVFRPSEPYGFCGRKAALNHAYALVPVCP